MRRAGLALACLLTCACAPAPAPVLPAPVSPPTAASSARAGSPDADCDGIPDARDLCPEAAEDRDAFEDEDGCPDLDDDHDGIPDLCDVCPREPETMNGFEDEDGCPDHPRVRVVAEHIVIVQHIQFAPGKAEPLAASTPILDAVAAVLRDHPEIRRIAVIGHASGDEPAAVALSLRRARAVVRALLSRGTDPGRLVAEGVGATQPLADPKSPGGREKNRRAELRVLDRDPPAEPPAPPRAIPPPPCRQAPPTPRGCVIP